MILSGLAIKERLGNDIVISDFSEDRLNPNSYNVRLHNEYAVYKDDVLDMKQPCEIEVRTIPEDGLVLQPGELYLMRTVEYTETKNLVPMLEGRSSVGRLGICIHVTAGFGDNGFKGYWTLEVTCTKPVRIYAGVEIGQVYFHTIEGEQTLYSSGKYQNNTGIQPSLIYKDFCKEVK